MTDPVFLLLHVLVLVYWLGGDLGAFYASRLVADPQRPAAGRVAAAKILLDIDMAPRMALIFAFPTGFALAVARGWISLDFAWVWLAFALAAAWAGLAWMVHLKAGPVVLVRRMDTAIRYAALFGLAGSAVTALIGVYQLPAFTAAAPKPSTGSVTKASECAPPATSKTISDASPSTRNHTR